MPTEAKGAGFDQNGARGVPGFINRLAEHVRAGFDVGCIDGESFHLITGGAFPELGIGCELLADRGGVGIAIVLDDKDNGDRKERCEVERFVDIAGAGGTVAEEGKPHGFLAKTTLRIDGACHGAEHRA